VDATCEAQVVDKECGIDERSKNSDAYPNGFNAGPIRYAEILTGQEETCGRPGASRASGSSPRVGDRPGVRKTSDS